MKRITTVGLGIALLAGCAPKPVPPPPPPEPDPMAAEVPTDPRQRVRDLSTAAGQLASFADQLPGGNEAEYRQRMSEGLTGLARALRLARGPAEGGAMRVQVTQIFSAARELQTRPAEYPVNTQVTAALRSAHAAMRDLARDQFAASTDLAEQLEALGDALRPLEVERGALYRVASATAFRRAVTALQTIASLYNARIPAEGEATSTMQPTTQQATPPVVPQTTETPPPAQPDAPVEPEPAPAPATPAPAPAQPPEELNK